MNIADEQQKSAAVLQTATATTTLTARAVGRYRCHVFNATNLHTTTGKSTESTLSTRSRGLRPVSSGSTEFDVERGDAELFAADRHILGGQHSSVW